MAEITAQLQQARVPASAIHAAVEFWQHCTAARFTATGLPGNKLRADAMEVIRGLDEPAVR